MTSNFRIASAFCAGVFSLGLITNAEAALVSRLGGAAVYDTDFNITWLADANLAASNTFGVSGIAASGIMNWGTAQSWIGAMNTASYLGYGDWRLPTTLQPDATCANQAIVSHGLGCSGSEMGHLFYGELGGVAGTDIQTTHNSFLNLFSNLQSDVYWSGTEYAPDSANKAWVFGFLYGGQDPDFKYSSNLYALAVRPGDIAAVPVPAAVWLLSSGLLGLLGIAKRRKT